MRIILINACIYLFLTIIGISFTLLTIPNPIDKFVNDYLMVPAYWLDALSKPWTLLTYMFIHKSLFHILFNMLVLYWFGNLYSEYLGNKKLIYTYFLGGVFGAIFYIISFNIFPYFNNIVFNAKAMGASAGIMAVVFASATLLPNYSIVLAIFGPIRLKYIAFFYLLIDLVSITGNNSGGHLAHIGGALFGFVLIKQLQKGNDWVKSISKVENLFSNKKTMKIVHSKTDKVNQNEIDQILDKISVSGYEKLTSKEKEMLFKYSNQHEKK